MSSATPIPLPQSVSKLPLVLLRSVMRWMWVALRDLPAQKCTVLIHRNWFRTGPTKPQQLSVVVNLPYREHLLSVTKSTTPTSCGIFQTPAMYKEVGKLKWGCEDRPRGQENSEGNWRQPQKAVPEDQEVSKGRTSLPNAIIKFPMYYY